MGEIRGSGSQFPRKLPNSMWSASIVERLKSIGTRLPPNVDGFESIDSISNEIQAPPNDKPTTWSSFKRRVRRSRRVAPDVNDSVGVDTHGEVGTTPRSNAEIAASDASAASTSVAEASSIGSVTPRPSDEGPWVLPKSIDDIFNKGIDQYLNNIQNSWFRDPHESSDNGADPRVKYWQFLKHIISLPLGIDESELEKSEGASSIDDITIEFDEELEEMKEIRTGYITNTLTEILSGNNYIKLNEFNKPHIKDLVEKAMTSNMSDVLVELVKVLDSDGIQFFFKECTEYLKQNNAPQKKETLKKALDLLLDNDTQMYHQWNQSNVRWNKFKDGCIQLSTDFYAEEYDKATEDIKGRLTYIQTDKEKNAAKKDEAESQKETEGFTRINYPGAFTLLRLINEGKFDPIKTQFNAIGIQSDNIRDTTNSAVSESLVYKIYGDLDKGEFKSLVEHLRFPSE